MFFPEHSTRESPGGLSKTGTPRHTIKADPYNTKGSNNSHLWVLLKAVPKGGLSRAQRIIKNAEPPDVYTEINWQ